MKSDARKVIIDRDSPTVVEIPCFLLADEVEVRGTDEDRPVEMKPSM